jgi:hypothetical protein
LPSALLLATKAERTGQRGTRTDREEEKGLLAARARAADGLFGQDEATAPQARQKRLPESGCTVHESRLRKSPGVVARYTTGHGTWQAGGAMCLEGQRPVVVAAPKREREREREA